jgi:hypothetical protein
MRCTPEPMLVATDELREGSSWLELELERMGSVCRRRASKRGGGGCGTLSLNRSGSSLFCLWVHGMRSIIVKWELSSISGKSSANGSNFINIYFQVSAVSKYLVETYLI